MKIIFLGLVGLFLGALFGGVLGVGLGLVWTTCFTQARSKAIRAYWCS
jgi:hypothetical protein